MVQSKVSQYKKEVDPSEKKVKQKKATETELNHRNLGGGVWREI